MRATICLLIMSVCFALVFAFSPTQGAEQIFDLSQVHVVYSNLFIAERKNDPLSISLTFRGPYNQTGWLVLSSVWKPLRIMSNNTDQPFTELSYDPQGMTSNPIADTSLVFAWDYDAVNGVAFIKFLTAPTVTVNIQFGVVSIVKFSTNKQSYAVSEMIEASLDVYGNYSAISSMSWIAKIKVKDMIGNLVNTVEQEFELSQNEAKQLTFSLDTFGEGAYTAELQIIDPRTSYAVGADQASFQVTGAQLPPPVPAWVLWAILALVGVALVIAGRFYRRRKRRLLGNKGPRAQKRHRLNHSRFVFSEPLDEYA